MRSLATYRVIALFAVSAIWAGACTPLDPLEDPVGITTTEEEKVAGSYNMVSIRRTDPPLDGIDAEYLNSDLPETVGYETSGSTLTRHRVLRSAVLQLRPSGAFLYDAEYAIFEARPGYDRGPLQRCTVLMDGVYRVQGPTVELRPAGEEEWTVVLVQDRDGRYRTIQFANTCTRLVGGAPVSFNVLLQDVRFDARR